VHGYTARSSLVLVLVLSLSGCKREAVGNESGAPPPSVEKPKIELVQLVQAPTSVGQKTQAVRSSSLALSVEFWQDGQKLGTNDSARTEEYTRESEVLGLVGNAAAKARVHYDHYALSELKAGQPPVHDQALTGHSYILDATDGKLVVAHEDGKPVLPIEEEALSHLHADLGQEDALVVALGTAPIARGTSVPMTDKLFRAVVSVGADTGQFKSGSYMLVATRKEQGRDAGVFQWSAEMHSEEQNGLTLNWHLKGQAVVALSPAVTLSTELAGTVDATGRTKQNGGSVDLAGAGTVKDSRRISFL
jgi:hypothetical protein